MKSGIEWIGEIPEHWDVMKFGYLFNFSRGLGITKQDLLNEGVPCVNYGEIHSKYGFRVDPEKNQLKCVLESYLKTSDKSLLRRGDFVFADTSEDIEGSGNFTCLDSDIPTFAGYHTVIARCLSENSYIFLAYYFDSLEYRNQIRNSVSGIKVYSITQAILKNTSVLLPPITEQTAIANYLDRKTAEIDELIADKKCLLELYEKEKSAIINQAVTKGINPDVSMKDSGIEWLEDIPEHWEIVRIKSISKHFKGFAFKSTDFKTAGVPIVKASNIKKWQIVDITSFIGDDNQIDVFEKVRLKKGDIILSTVGSKPDVINSAVGQLAAVSEEFHSSYLNQNTLCLRPNEQISDLFFKYTFLSKYFRANLDSISAWIANQAYLEVEDILSIQIIMPPFDEQIIISNHIETECARIEAKKSRTEKLIELLTEYRTALISEVVTGKIKVGN